MAFERVEKAAEHKGGGVPHKHMSACLRISHSLLHLYDTTIEERVFGVIAILEGPFVKGLERSNVRR